MIPEGSGGYYSLTGLDRSDCVHHIVSLKKQSARIKAEVSGLSERKKLRHRRLVNERRLGAQ